ncbi:hypothetical protein K7W42_13880 [Deinococcus sp. HMF7604]|uniref:hypothetical protein n=1 Tax=Deinococcus betulae TaxID=2873312 RepID=UPI001CCEFB30|nr:hypothetical protein [Deinococcus betulae]MBZ9751945.1 hypothetical protein [Deinococcus betulae]
MPLILADELPFGGAALPTTTQLSFLEAPLPQVVQGFGTQQRALGRACRTSPPLQEQTGNSLMRLRPLSFLGRPHLFVPTDSRWTAYFNDYPLGTNMQAIVPDLARSLACRALWIEALPWQTNTEPTEALGFTVLEPHRSDWRRSVGLRNQNGFWRFWQLGTPLPFEDTVRYRFRRRQRRFDLTCLRHYAGALGVRPFDESFYLAGAVHVTCGASVK